MEGSVLAQERGEANSTHLAGSRQMWAGASETMHFPAASARRSDRQQDGWIGPVAEGCELLRTRRLAAEYVGKATGTLNLADASARRSVSPPGRGSGLRARGLGSRAARRTTPLREGRLASGIAPRGGAASGSASESPELGQRRANRTLPVSPRAGGGGAPSSRLRIRRGGITRARQPAAGGEDQAATTGCYSRLSDPARTRHHP